MLGTWMTGAVAASGGRSSPPLQPLLHPGPPIPNSLVELKELPVILQEHWALSQSWPLPKLYALPRMPFPTWTARRSPHSTPRLCCVASPAFLIASSYPGMTELLPLYLPQPPQVAFCPPQQQRGRLTWNQAPLIPKTLMFSEISAPGQFSAKPELSNMVFMSPRWLLRVETQLVQTENGCQVKYTIQKTV